MEINENRPSARYYSLSNNQLQIDHGSLCHIEMIIPYCTKVYGIYETAVWDKLCEGLLLVIRTININDQACLDYYYECSGCSCCQSIPTSFVQFLL